MRYKLPQHVVSVRHGPDTVLLDLRQNLYFSLNEVGGRCWALFADDHSIDQVITTLAGEYEMPSVDVRIDVERLAKELEASGLVERTD
jgi:hypothetical protein